jgi:hypothetical protein
LLNECAEQYGMKQDDFSIILNSLKTIEWNQSFDIFLQT